MATRHTRTLSPSPFYHSFSLRHADHHRQLVSHSVRTWSVCLICWWMSCINNGVCWHFVYIRQRFLLVIDFHTQNTNTQWRVRSAGANKRRKENYFYLTNERRKITKEISTFEGKAVFSCGKFSDGEVESGWWGWCWCYNWILMLHLHQGTCKIIL